MLATRHSAKCLSIHRHSPATHRFTRQIGSMRMTFEVGQIYRSVGERIVVQKIGEDMVESILVSNFYILWQ